MNFIEEYNNKENIKLNWFKHNSAIFLQILYYLKF